MILCICAVSQEAAAIIQYFTAQDRHRVVEKCGWRLWQGQIAGCSIQLLQTGMGAERAQTAMEAVVSVYPVSQVLNFGFGAAAAAGLAVGDTVICSSFQTRQRDASHDRLYASTALLQAAQKAHPHPPAPPHVPQPPAGASLYTYDCLTVDRVVCDPQEKHRLGRDYRVQMIDMESYALACLAVRRNIPFLALRTVSDDVHEALPPFDSILHPNGAVHWPAAIQRWMLHPGDLPRLWRMARHAQRAQASLSAWIPGMIHLLSASS